MELIYRIVDIILPVLLITVAGILYANYRGAVVREEMGHVNKICIDIFAPALVFTALSSKEFDLLHNIPLVWAGLGIALGSALLAWPIAKWLGYDVRSFVPPMMYNNCMNMGLPLALFAFGQQGLSPAVTLFVACTVVYFTLGMKILASNGKSAKKSVLYVFWTPMMGAIVLGIVFSLMRFDVPHVLFVSLKMLGEACIPIMLFSLGVRLYGVNVQHWKIGVVGAVVCPVVGLIMAFILEHVLEMTPLQRSQMYLFSVLPPAVFCFMAAEQYQQEPDKVAAIVLVGNIAALIFVPVGLWIGLH
jgi:predicted permease